jgi:hypothetical protein
MTQAGHNPAEIMHMNMPTLVKTPWTPASRSSAEGPSSQRLEVRPPSLRQAPESWLGRFWFWLAAPEPQQASGPVSRLPAVRKDFRAALLDLPADRAADLMRRIELTRSLRELWHLRADVYRVVAIAHSQTVAEARLAALNCHFPTRAPRSGFAPL